MKKKYKQPQPFKPTIEEEREIMEHVALLFSENKVIVSQIYPQLEVRGKIKNN